MSAPLELEPRVIECWSEVLGTTDLQDTITDVTYHVIRRGDVEPVENYCRAVARRLYLPRTMSGPRLLRMCCSVWVEQLDDIGPEWQPREVLIAKVVSSCPVPGLWNGAWVPMADPTRPPSPSRLYRQLTRLLGLPVDVEEHVLQEAIAEALCGPEPEPECEELVGMQIEPKRRQRSVVTIAEADAFGPDFEEEGMRPDEVVAPRPRRRGLTATNRRQR